MPEWQALDLGPGELAAMTLALHTAGAVVLLDDALARRIAERALEVWGTLRVLLEGKRAGHVEHIAPILDRLVAGGMFSVMASADAFSRWPRSADA